MKDRRTNRGSFQIESRNNAFHVEFTRRVVDGEMVNDLHCLVGDLHDDKSLRGVVFHLGHFGFRFGPACRISPSIAKLGPDAGMSVLTRLEKSLAMIERLPHPIIVVLDGPIGSVGLELALVADLTISTPTTVFYLGG